MTVYKGLGIFYALLGGRRETKHYRLEAYCHSGGDRIRLIQTFPVKIGHLIH